MSDGGAPAFHEIYRIELAYVWRSLRRLGVPPADVEDLAHDVFVIVHRKLSTYDPARPLRPWLFGIAFRVAAASRRLLRTGLEVTVADVPRSAAATTADGEAEALASERRRRVLAALLSLDLDQRAVVVLHDIDGAPAPDIAAALEVKLNTVYSRLRLGRAKLAAHLAGLAGKKGAA